MPGAKNQYGISTKSFNKIESGKTLPKQISQPPQNIQADLGGQSMGKSFNRKQNLARAEALLADEDDLN